MITTPSNLTGNQDFVYTCVILIILFIQSFLLTIGWINFYRLKKSVKNKTEYKPLMAWLWKN